MRRKRKRCRQSAAPTMFPFLAVLICTMGALISVLVMGVRQAQVHADEIIGHSQQENSELAEETQRQQYALENYQWRSEVLNGQREQEQEQIADNRLSLSHLEHHALQLEEQLALLRARSERLRNSRAGDVLDETKLREQIRTIEDKLEAARTELQQQRIASREQSQSFAIIPYAGEKGTLRRPIYLECVAEGILIQPEAILITEAEMAGPPGPGNPLDACLRAIREFYSEHTGDDQVSPYPLIIVRASGVMSYGVARQAMQDWQDEFGYELIDDEMKLVFPRPQPALAQTLRHTIETARSRQRALAATMPSRYRTNHPGFKSQPRTGQTEYPRDSAEQSGDEGRDTAYSGSSDGAANTTGETNTPVDNVQQQGNGGNRANGAADLRTGMQGRQPGWGLNKKVSPGPAITRPVRVVCDGKQLVIMPAVGERGQPVVVPVDGLLIDAIDPFVRALHEYTKRWGIALAGGYWKPELHIEVLSDGAEHYYQLREYLRRSGIEVTQRIESKP